MTYLKNSHIYFTKLIQIIKISSNLNSPRQLTPKAKKKLQLIKQKIQQTFVYHINYNSHFQIYVFDTKISPTAL